MRHFQKIILTAVLTLIASLSFAQSVPNIEKIKSLIEGSYNLVEWVDGETQLSPPAVSARFIIKDGIVTWIANKAVGGDQLSFQVLGHIRSRLRPFPTAIAPTRLRAGLMEFLMSSYKRLALQI